MTPIATFLNDVPIFAALSDAARAALAEACTLQHLEDGDLLFREGDPGDALFLVRDGTISISVRGEDGARVPVATIHAGEFLGEMSIVEREPRSATGTADGPTTVVRLAGADFDDLLSREPAVATGIMLRMLPVVAARLENTGALVSDMVRWGEDARRRAFTDPLTGLYNRRFLDQSLGDQIARARRDRTPLSLVMMDLDHFTAINTEYGPEVGDRLIAAVTPVIRAAFADSHILARYGGDEFTFILPDCNAPTAERHCESLLTALPTVDLLRRSGGTIRTVTASMGIAAYPTDATTEQGLRECADRALYRAKELGRDRVYTQASSAEEP